MILLPGIHGFARPGEQCTEEKILACCQCGARRTVRIGKYVPKCSKCKDQTYWYEVTTD